MFEYDYYVKVILIGDNNEGKSYLATKFCKSAYSLEYKHTLGLDFHGKTINVLDKVMKIQIWELLAEERFITHFRSYYGGALGAIIISDITKPDFQDEFETNVKFIKERSGDIPIMLFAFNADTKSFQALSGLREMITADNLIAESNFKIAPIPVENPEEIFTKMGEHIIKRLNVSPLPKPKYRSPTKTKFRINKYLKLRLESGKTNVYVGGRLFKQCKFLLLEIPIKNITDYDEIESIDEAAEKLDRSLEIGRPRKFYVSPDVEFWGHCSNLQVWYENKYDTRILHSNLAFPLLKALVKAGDPLAKRVFKDEIAQRFVSGYPSVIKYLLNEDYLDYLNKEEIKALLEDPNFLANMKNWYMDAKEIQKWKSKSLKRKLKELKIPHI